EYQNCDSKNIKIGSLRANKIGIMCVSQELIYKEKQSDGSDTQRIARRFRIYVDRNAVTNGKLNNNYTKVYECINYGQLIGDTGKYKDKVLPVINEPVCKENPTATIRIDTVTEKTLEYEHLFIRGIESEIIMSGNVTNNTDSTSTDTKLPPKLVVQPEYEITQKGQLINVDASQSSSPTGKIDCYYFKQIGVWKSETERLKLNVIQGGKLGVCDVT